MSLSEKAGCPLTSLNPVEQNSQDSMSTTETDPDDEMAQEPVEQKQWLKSTGWASLQLCMICSVGLASKSALAFHLKTSHPERHPYCCLSCMNLFNNNNNLQMHMSNVHLSKSVHCKHCEYATMTKSCMRLHVQQHTSGLLCNKCGQKYLIPAALKHHSVLHEK